jgi:hypothetical protein
MSEQTHGAAAAIRLQAITDELLGEVRRLPVEATSKNPRWGVTPASFVVDQLLVGHVEKHLGQIRRNAGQFAERS